ncbi:hypothetical protein TorRG33x02_341950 [Trema orientale]|uniref:Uncharacterized protein n=1 Tax=Trema orientale TaxID=63057 RepID=A0A2P5AT46_TREOI|nr:hypothetical protein TorRG33x02_341950 [Trema orientale]
MENNVGGDEHNALENHVVEIKDHLRSVSGKLDLAMEELSAVRAEFQAFYDNFRATKREIVEVLAEVARMMRERRLIRNANRGNNRNGDDHESDHSTSGEENGLGDVEDGMLESDD